MLDTLRIAMTLAAFASFLWIAWWAYAPSRKEEWERKGRLDELDNDADQGSGNRN